MNSTISQIIWHGVNAIALESENLITVIVPEMGAKLVSLFDKRSQREWLVGPGNRPFQKVPYGSPFTEQDMSGWDEMFLTIVACDYPAPGVHHGLSLPDHGEVWTLSWEVEQATNERLTLSVNGPALPYRLTRTAEYVSPFVLQLSYRLVNLGQEAMPYLWSAHPQFACGQSAEVIFPPQVTEVCNSLPEAYGWGIPETRFGWKKAIKPNGDHVRIDQIGSPSQHQARKFFVLPDVRADWSGLINRPSNDWLLMEWDSNLIPYLGLWIDEGAISAESVAAPEPMTGFYDSLAVAWDKKRVAMIAPGASADWKLSVRFGTGDETFPYENSQ
jgi:galactose mutarotase-like enzyme